LKPDLAEAHYNLGLALKHKSRSDEAVTCYSKAVHFRPDFPEAHNNLGDALQEIGRVEEAILHYLRAIDLNPRYHEAFYNLADALTQRGEVQAAMDCYRAALAVKPDYVEALNNLGSLLYNCLDLQAALRCFRRAVAIDPTHANAFNNMGNILKDLGEFAEADQCYDRAIAHKPDNPEPRLNRCSLRLLQGDFAGGLPDYELRFRTSILRSRAYPQPSWEGEALANKTIVIQTEQGLGDTIHFIRYAKLCKALGATVFVECQKPLLKLLRSYEAIDRLFAYDDEIPPFDYHVSLLSLPRLFGTTIETIPAEVPYLYAEPSLVSDWGTALGSISGFKICVNWHGRTSVGWHRLRDIPVEYITSLARLPHVRLISVQQGASKELKGAGVPFWFPPDDFDLTHGAFMDTAAVMTNTDLVITSDTSIAHLAGALGVRVWVALPFTPDWRWLLVRGDSPWYPTMRLFRQRAPGDWKSVFEEMTSALGLIVAEI
jgi:tetratricopeptide (TPR) repeat protein